jgi:hypothetical protein
MIAGWLARAGFLLLLVAPLSSACAQTPAPPRSFEAIAASANEIRLYWLPAAGATGYAIERDGQTLTRLPAQTTEYADTGLRADTLHRYAVRAVHSGGTSAPRTYTERTFPALPAAPSRSRMPVLHCDVFVAQGNASGVAAAYEAARRGQKVILIEPTTRLGGMPVNGLSASDIRNSRNGSGFFLRFKDRVVELYAAEGLKVNGIKYEPRIAHQAVKSLLYEVPNLTLYRKFRLAKVRSVPVAPGSERKRVESVIVEQAEGNGAATGFRMEIRAKFYIDSTDSGDLAAWAGARFRIGREPKSALEPHNGVIYYDRKARAPLPGSTGKGDKRIQAYSYLLTVKDYGPNADKTLPKPPGFRREEFDDPALPDWKSTWAASSGTMPNGKYELNQHPKGGDVQGVNYKYPTGDYKERFRVDLLHRERVLRYLYYIQTVYGMKNLGLPDDEYRDSGGFPPLLYVREGRRILGEQLPLEADITNARSFWRPESIGIGDYPMDSHAVREKTDDDPRHMGEGEWWLVHLTPWYAIPLGVMVPQFLDNVLVTTAVSSTHVSYGTYRMEPVRMQFGAAAGVAANIANRFGLVARDIPARQVQWEMLPSFSNTLSDPYLVLHVFPDVPQDHPRYRYIQYLAVRGFLPLTGENFMPDAPTTDAETKQWLLRLAQRAERVHYDLHRETLNALVNQTMSERPMTRGEIALWLTRILRWSPRGETSRYTDISDHAVRQAAEALAQRGIDSTLWDSWDAIEGGGKLRFRPDAPLTHSDMFLTLYLAQIGIGPLFFDHPDDYRNGRAPSENTPD